MQIYSIEFLRKKINAYTFTKKLLKRKNNTSVRTHFRNIYYYFQILINL